MPFGPRTAFAKCGLVPQMNGAAKLRRYEKCTDERKIAQAITASMPLVSTICSNFAAAPLGCFSAEGDSHF